MSLSAAIILRGRSRHLCVAGCGFSICADSFLRHRVTIVTYEVEILFSSCDLEKVQDLAQDPQPIKQQIQGPSSRLPTAELSRFPVHCAPF